MLAHRGSNNNQLMSKANDYLQNISNNFPIFKVLVHLLLANIAYFFQGVCWLALVTHIFEMDFDLKVACESIVFTH